jgi:myosin heavy subunit
VSQHEGERNYHVFYHMCAGVTGEFKVVYVHVYIYI